MKLSARMAAGRLWILVLNQVSLLHTSDTTSLDILAQWARLTGIQLLRMKDNTRIPFAHLSLTWFSRAGGLRHGGLLLMNLGEQPQPNRETLLTELLHL
jgi:hypothetical protein